MHTPADTPTDARADVRPVGVRPAGDRFRLRHRWLIEGPIDVAFDLLSRGTTFPDWWAPVFLSAETDDPEPVVGSRVRYRVRARLPYRLDWDVTLRRLEPPHVIQTDTVVVLGGRFRLSGPIRFTLTETPHGVEIRNEQLMTTDRRLPSPLRALAQRAFAYNHAWAFRVGGRGLQRAVDEAVTVTGRSDQETLRQTS
jgi:hypothetical protein